MDFEYLDSRSVQNVARWFFSQSRDGFALSRLGVILAVNEAWCDILGVSAETAIGQTAADILSPRDLEAYAESNAQLSVRGEDEFEVRLQTARGEVWVSGSVRRGVDGYALIVARDVTDERRLAVEQETAAHIRSLLAVRANILTWIFSPADGQFHVDSATDAFAPGTWRVALDEMLQRTDADQRDGFTAALMTSVKTGDPQQFGFRYSDPDGGVRRLDAYWSGLSREDDGRWRIAGLTRDLTEVMEARDAALEGERLAREAGRVKSRFLANMSHEFRTPLNGVLGVLHLLKTELASPEAVRLLAEATASGRVLTRLLNDLVDLADLDAGRLTLCDETFSPAALLEELITDPRQDASAKGLTLTSTTPSQTPMIIADRGRLRQILASLIDNAVKFTDRGVVVVRLCVRGDEAGRTIRFEIEDTGVGVAPETLDRLFRPFSQANDAVTRRFGGVGSGLALSRSLARLMGGDLGGMSAPGSGSTFWVELPAPTAHVEEAAPAEAAPLEGLDVLIVDDNATNRLVATKLVEQLGADVATANDGAQAVNAVVQTDYDLVLMDIQMPVMDGMEATRTIRALSAPVSQVPIVAVTANVAAEQVADYAAAGMNGVVAKPISPAALLTEISRLTAPPRQTRIHRLIYHSSVSPAVLPRLNAVMAEIVHAAQAANRAASLTGALLGCGGWFLQTLEGPEPAVEATFARIETDARHENVTRLLPDADEGRLFGRWAMIGYLFSPTDAGISSFLRRDGAFDPRSQSAAANLALLKAVSDVQVACTG